MKYTKSIITALLFLTISLLSSCKDKCETTGNCKLSPDAGLCEAAIPRYYFDKGEQKCKEFLWGGCGGVVPFETMEECSDCACE